MQTDDEPPGGTRRKDLTSQVSQEEMRVKIQVNRLVGLGEVMREVYDNLSQPSEKIAEAYKHHERELALLIAYQKESNY